MPKRGSGYPDAQLSIFKMPKLEGRGRLEGSGMNGANLSAVWDVFWFF
jgi:hypothetical protein